jgi:ATP phosphoribosyltransferase
MGITGSDLVEEADAAIDVRMRLGMGKCRLAFCVPEDSDIQSAAQLDQSRIATSFPSVTRRYLAERQAQAHLVSLSGSVEVMIQLGIADAIVDLVETGSTLAANRLRILEEIGSYETVLIQNDRCSDPITADRVVRRLQGVVIARDYSLLEYNVPKLKLAEAEQITPGFNSPTINSLEDDQWCSVRVMVKRRDVIESMERLEELGASAIIVTPISNCRL